MRFCSVVTEATLPHARVLAKALHREYPTASFHVLAVGAGTQVANAEFELVRPDDLAAELQRLLAVYPWTDVELIARAKLLRHLLAEDGGPVALVGPAVHLCGPLDALTDALERHSVVVVPKLLEPLPDDEHAPGQEDLVEDGLHSRALMAARPGSEADDVLAWWLEGLTRTLPVLAASERARPRSRPAGELNRWLDLMPARFPGMVGLTSDPGLCVSAWNLHERPLASANGQLLAGGRPVGIVDFEGFDPRRPYWFAAEADRVRVPDDRLLAETCERYATELREHGWHEPPLRDALGRRLSNDLVLDSGLLHRLAEARLQGEDFGDVLTLEGCERFTTWLAEPGPLGAYAGINRFLFGIWRDRPDLATAYPELDGPDGLGYAGWAHIYGREEVGIPERLLPTLPPHIDPPERKRDAAADSRSAVVNVAGFFRGTLGLGAAARAYVDALGAAGIRLTTTTVDVPDLASGDAVSGYAHVEFEDRAHAEPPNFNLICVNADELPVFASAVDAEFWEGRRSIGVWAWETDHIPERWARAFPYVDEIWTYSRYVAQNIGWVAPVPVISIPIPVVAPPPAPDPLAGELPPGFRFLFVFDLFSTLQRKNPVGLIQAYRRAFKPDEGPHLVVKTLHGRTRAEDFDELRWAARDRPDIFIIDRSLSSSQRDGLMASCDCYVSLHRSEGFGLTLAECMAIGKPVIATAYSGNLDFMTPVNSYLVEYSPTRVGPRGEQYPADGWWAEPDLDHAAAVMRHVWEQPEDAHRRGERARADIATGLSPAVVGSIARARLAFGGG